MSDIAYIVIGEIIVSVTFAAGVLVGSSLTLRKGDRDKSAE